MEPWGLLSQWQRYHGSLTEEQQREFLSKKEVRLLCRYEESLVDEVISGEPTLVKALEQVRATVSRNKARKQDERRVRKAANQRERSARAQRKVRETSERKAAEQKAEADRHKERESNRCEACGLAIDITGRCGCS